MPIRSYEEGFNKRMNNPEYKKIYERNKNMTDYEKIIKALDKKGYSVKILRIVEFDDIGVYVNTVEEGMYLITYQELNEIEQ